MQLSHVNVDEAIYTYKRDLRLMNVQARLAKGETGLQKMTREIERA